MKWVVRVLSVLAFVAAASPLAAQKPAERQLPKPNYELASQWSSAKIGKLIFDTAVTPHWLEFSERFCGDSADSRACSCHNADLVVHRLRSSSID